MLFILFQKIKAETTYTTLAGTNVNTDAGCVGKNNEIVVANIKTANKFELLPSDSEGESDYQELRSKLKRKITTEEDVVRKKPKLIKLPPWDRKAEEFLHKFHQEEFNKNHWGVWRRVQDRMYTAGYLVDEIVGRKKHYDRYVAKNQPRVNFEQLKAKLADRNQY